MKKIVTLLVSLFAVLALVSCSKKTEETKMISSSEISFSGKDKKMLRVASDSVKVMLVNVNEEKDRWEVRVVIPVQNTMPWKNFPKSEQNVNKRASEYYEPKMGSMHVDYMDANGSKLDVEVSPEWNVIKSVLSSDEISTENMLVKDSWDNLGDKSYTKAKTNFDKIAKISISNMELSKVTRVSESSSSSYSRSSSSSYRDDFEDAYNEAKDTYEKAMDTYEKTLDAYDKALDAAKSVGF